jgi:hypothetical protein
MPNYRDCRNCTGAKEPERLAEYYCLACQRASDEAAEHATREGGDIGSARKTALGRLSPGSMSRKHPGMPFSRVDTTEAQERMNNGQS